MWPSSVLRPNKHGSFFGFHAAVAKTCDWDVFSFLGLVPEKKVFPSPTLDEVLATEMSDPAIASGTDCGVELDKSKIDGTIFPDSFEMDSKIGDPS